jgi:hypothetical protein
MTFGNRGFREELIHIGLPIGWIESATAYWDAIYPDYQTTTPTLSLGHVSFIEPNNGLDLSARRRQEIRWLELTGVLPEDTRCTILLPIHNEKDLLPALFTSLSASDIPEAARITTLFVTCGCTDNDVSESLINDYMKSFGRVAIKSTDDLFENDIPDPQLDDTCTVVEFGNRNIIHLNTKQSGKPGALKIVNALEQNRNPVIINIDADSFVEPASIALIYGKAYESFVSNPSDILAVFGNPIKVDRTDKINLYDELGHESVMPLIIDDIIPTFRSPTIKVKGYFHAWNPRVMQSVGGVPRIEPADWVLDLIAINNNLRTIECAESCIWITQSQTFKARREVLIRRYRNIRAIMDEYPELSTIAKNEFIFMETPGERRRIIRSWFSQAGLPVSSSEYMERVWDDIITEGDRLYESTDPIWERIPGSR